MMKTDRFEIWVAGATALLIAVCAIGISATFNQAIAEGAEGGKPANESSDPALMQDSDRPQQGQLDRPADTQRVEQFDSQRHTANYAREEGHSKEGCRASKLIGMTVKSKGDKEVGSIHDLMIGEDGKVKYAAVSFGGFLGMGDKLFAVPFDRIHVEKGADDQDESYAHIDVTEQKLSNKKGFDQNNWPDEADETFEIGARPTIQNEEVQR